MPRREDVQAGLRAMAELIGHEVTSEARQGEQVREYRARCSCGWSAPWGVRMRDVLRLGTRHIAQVADQLSPQDRRRVALALLDATDYRAS